MSEGYASRLSEYKDKGICGLPEVFDSKRTIENKVKKLAQLMEEASQVVLITGAGISTSAGIPDFRGPSGIWTQEKEAQSKKREAQSKGGRKRKRITTQREMPDRLENFADAKPTICHRAITKLTSIGKVNYVITQNVDGLHRRSGLPRDKHSSVHGCVFTEKCEECGSEFFRDFDCGGMSFQPTGRNCSLCKGILRDTLLDWEDALPLDDLKRASAECQTPGTLVITLGTSLRIQPVGDLPTEAAKYCIINLQKTPHDEGAELLIRGTADGIMNDLLIHLGMPKWQEEACPPIERVWTPKTKPVKESD